MAILINILSQSDRKAFEIPPVFTDEERTSFFDIPRWASKLIKTLRTPTNKIGFVLQLGYFRSANTFFIAKTFHSDDIASVAKLLKIRQKKIGIKSYTGATYGRRQSIILEDQSLRLSCGSTETLS